MSNGLRRIRAPLRTSFLCSNPVLGEALDRMLRLGGRPDTVKWSGFVVPVVNVHDYFKIDLYKGVNSADGDGDKRVELNLATGYITVPESQTWEILSWHIESDNIDTDCIGFYTSESGGEYFWIKNYAAGTAFSDSSLFPLLLPSGVSLAYHALNDGGADVVRNFIMIKKYLKVSDSWD